MFSLKSVDCAENIPPEWQFPVFVKGETNWTVLALRKKYGGCVVVFHFYLIHYTHFKISRAPTVSFLI